MNGKQVGAIISLIVAIPVIIGLMILLTNSSNLDNIEKSAELVANSAVPWWIGILEWFAGLPGIIGAILVIGLIFFLKWIGEIK